MVYKVDELKVYRGKDIYITDKIVVSQPTLDKIEEFGEQRYFNAVYTLTSVGADLKWQLWDKFQTDYTKINDYDLFIKLTNFLVSSKKSLYKELTEHRDIYADKLAELSEDILEEMKINPLALTLKEKVTYSTLYNEVMSNYKISKKYIDVYGNFYTKDDVEKFKYNPDDYIFTDIDFDDFQVMKNENNNQIILYNEKRDITIDRFIYSQIVDVVRKIHCLKRNNQVPANERTKMDLIEDARDEAMASANKPYKSVILPLLSSLKVKCGQCGNDEIWNMKIGELLYDIKRTNKIQDATMLLQGAYSGFASLKEVDKKRLDWTGDID